MIFPLLFGAIASALFAPAPVVIEERNPDDIDTRAFDMGFHGSGIMGRPWQETAFIGDLYDTDAHSPKHRRPGRTRAGDLVMAGILAGRTSADDYRCHPHRRSRPKRGNISLLPRERTRT